MEGNGSTNKDIARELHISEPTVKSHMKAIFVKVKVSNVGVCPTWHNGAGGKAWVFLDEITIK